MMQHSSTGPPTCLKVWHCVCDLGAFLGHPTAVHCACTFPPGPQTLAPLPHPTPTPHTLTRAALIWDSQREIGFGATTVLECSTRFGRGCSMETSRIVVGVVVHDPSGFTEEARAQHRRQKQAWREGASSWSPLRRLWFGLVHRAVKARYGARVGLKW
jgi:hypothetical protein